MCQIDREINYIYLSYYQPLKQLSRLGKGDKIRVCVTL